MKRKKPAAPVAAAAAAEQSAAPEKLKPAGLPARDVGMIIAFSLLLFVSMTVQTGRMSLILAALVAVSAVGFSFYNQLLRYHPVGQIAIYNAFIPVLGVVLSCLLLGEPFSWRYLLSGALVTVGICAVNLPGKGKN